MLKENPNLQNFNRLPLNYGLGQIKEFANEFETYGFVKSLGFLNSPFIECYLFFSPLLITSDADVVKWITITKKFTKTEVAFKMFEGLIGKGLPSIDGDQWKFHRNLIMPVFNPQNLQKMFKKMYKDVEDQIKDWKDEMAIENFISTSSEISLKIICSSGFGQDLDGLNDLAHLFEKLVDHYLPVIIGLSTIGTFYPSLPVPSTQRFKEIKKKIEGVINDIIEKRRNQGSKKEASELLTIMIQANDDEGKKFTNQELIDESLTFLFAGHDTTSATVSFALYLLSKNPEIQKNLQKEIDSVYKIGLTYDNITNMKYLDNVIKETLRIYPPALIISRTSNESTTIKDYPIPMGANFFINIVGLHHNPKYWKNPEEFNPDRFNEPYEKYAYIPFSVGPRDCAGKNFASITVPLILTILLRKYKVEFSSKEDILVNTTFVTKPSGLKLKFIKRI